MQHRTRMFPCLQIVPAARSPYRNILLGFCLAVQQRWQQRVYWLRFCPVLSVRVMLLFGNELCYVAAKYTHRLFGREMERGITWVTWVEWACGRCPGPRAGLAQQPQFWFLFLRWQSAEQCDQGAYCTGCSTRSLGQHICSAESEAWRQERGKETGAQPCQLSRSTCLQLINPARLEPAFRGPEGPALHSWLQGSRAGIPTLASWGLGLDPGGFITSSSTPRCCSQSQILYSMGPSLALYQRFELFLALMNQLQIIRRHHHYVGID